MKIEYLFRTCLFTKTVKENNKRELNASSEYVSSQGSFKAPDVDYEKSQLRTLGKCFWGHRL